MVIRRDKLWRTRIVIAASLLAACALGVAAPGPLLGQGQEATKSSGVAAKAPTTAAPTSGEAKKRQGAAPNASDEKKGAESPDSYDGTEPDDIAVTELEGGAASPADAAPTGLLDQLVENLSWIVIVMAAAVALWFGLRLFLGRVQESSGQSGRRRTPGGQSDDSLAPVVLGTGAPFPGQRDPLEDLQSRMMKMETQLDTIRRRLATLEQRGPAETVTPTNFGRTQALAADSMVLDRRNNPVSLPEDETAGYREQRAPAEVSAPPAPAGSRVAASEQELTNRYNSADSAAEMQGLAERIRAEYYTNERSGDLAALIKSDVDRFWLIPLPNRPDEALLLPGFALRKAWQKYRQYTSDHPLAHHFDLVPGDRFVLNRAARIARGQDGIWQLVQKGEVGGIL